MPERIARTQSRIAGAPWLAAFLAIGIAAGAGGPSYAQDSGPALRESIEPDDAPQPGPGGNAQNPGADVPAAPPRTSTNFGRRRPPAAYPGRRKQAKKPLPRSEPYLSAPRDIRRDSVQPAAAPVPVAYAQPAHIPRPPRPRLDPAPYAPLGVEAGSLRLFPFVETSIGFDSNANRNPVLIRGSSFIRLDAGLKAQSNWSVHEFKADIAGAYSKLFQVAGADRPEGAAKFNLRLDATRDTKINLELRGSLTTQRPGSPEVNANVTGRPPVFSYGATGGVTQNFGRLETNISALADRTAYEDGTLSNGNIVALSREDYTAYGLRGRIGYEVTPGIKPFAEMTVDTRQRDTPVDSAGFQRNSNGVNARAGSSFEITRTLTGEISAGYLNRKYADANLPELRGATFDASLIWTATPLTTVTFRASTSANETSVANASGYITRRASVEINHALLRNLTLSGLAQWRNDKYQGIALSQDVFTGAFRVEYALTRSVVVKGSFTHERLNSSVPGADYTANVYLLGLRLQR